MTYQPITTAPTDTRVMVRTQGGKEFEASRGFGYVDADENDCWGWAAYREWEAPECWTDGVCWTENGMGKPSDQPVAWKHI